jgi:C-terminal processing protease CtpA/Prc
MKHSIWSRLAIAGATLLLLTAAAAPAWAADDDDDDEEAFLGVYPKALDDDTRSALNYEKGEGVLVEDVVDEGPAEEAGVEAGDIILKMDAQTVDSPEALRSAIRKHKPGDEMALVILREGKEKSLKVELGEEPESGLNFEREYHFGPHPDTGGWLGVETITLEDQLAEYFGVKSGALISQVVKDSPADKAGLKAGDVIVQLGDDEVESSEDLYAAVRSREPETKVDVQLARKGVAMTIPATLAKSQSSSANVFKKKIILNSGGEYFDPEEIGEHVRNALGELNIHIDAGRDELRERFEELRQELKELKEELNALKENREHKSEKK